ncbi:MAG: TIR domain-containing protein [Cyanobacteria bacterium J06635_1]
MRKILILAANPKGTSRLRLDEEVRDINEGLKRAKRRDDFEIVQRWVVRPRDFQQAMLDETPQIVHFSGHGEWEAGICLEGPTGQAQLVTGEALANLFALFSDSLECVVLNGCYSEAQAQEIVVHVPYVIGMNQAVRDRAAIEFAVGLYDALGAGQSVERAFQFGCVAMEMAGTDEQNKPVLLTGSKKAIANIPQEPTGTASAATEKSEASHKETLEVFFSYAHEDEPLRDKLATHLKLLERQKVITGWYDRDINAGGDWKTEILDQLNRADIILLLISADFLASDFCWGVELEQAMTRHDEKSACVIPIILRSVDWKGTPFSKLQALPKNAEPVTDWANQDQAFTDIAKGIRKVAERLKK